MKFLLGDSGPGSVVNDDLSDMSACLSTTTWTDSDGLSICLAEGWQETRPDDIPGVRSVNGVLGAGNFATVYSCDMVDATGAIGTYAVKIPQKKGIDLYDEMNHQASFSHPNLVKVVMAIDHPHALVLELCAGGSLYGALHGSMISEAMDAIGLKARITAMIDIVSATSHLHERGVIHRDIKSRNIYLSAPITDASLPRLKLGDFGLCALVKGPMTRWTGTLRYMAPEVMSSACYGCPADVYSLGVLMFELVTGRVPFDEFKLPCPRLVMHVVNGNRPDLTVLESDLVSAYVACLIVACWSGVPEERPSAVAGMQRLHSLSAKVPGGLKVHASPQRGSREVH